MSLISEFFSLASMLFHKVRTDGKLDPITMRHFPFKKYEFMMWCDNLISRSKEFLMTKDEEQHEKCHLWQAITNYDWWYQYYWHYYWEWTKVFFKSGLSFRTAYACNPFEVEAKGNESLNLYNIGTNTWKKYRIKNPRTTYKCNRMQWKLFCQELAKEVQL